ncbi:tetratricopeptide repeat protein [Bradyrhizobium canariense]|uniref:tetratricopeptide repeat protein n=1 Tax=Bradyrhizobium canariense TaxID=255045 RepID=UPI001B89E7DD|nr:tetratricopeptide repeat protein [Bradyrhizobium canariense]MBR0954211.1 sel1 repeat family protein [Bradyrhizobium canariense]
MSAAAQQQFLVRERKGPLRVLLDLHAANATFRGFAEFAVIGAIVLFFIHGLQALPSVGLPNRLPASAPVSEKDIRTQDDIARLGRRNNAALPRLNELGLDETHFAGDAEPLRATLVEAWRAYRSKHSLKSIQLLQGADAGNPRVLLLRGLATMAQPENGALRAGALDLEAAAAKGDVKAMSVLGALYIIGTPGLQNDLEKGQKLILKAAATGDADASRVAGMGYMSGWMGSIDPARAAKYLRFAADRNDPKAMLFLADMYFTGRGVAKDDVEGDSLAEKSAVLGNREAQSVVGLRRMYAYMAGVSDNPSDALKWLELAAERNEPSALQGLANYYLDYAAKSGQLDVGRGMELLKRCVDQTGHPGCAMSYASLLDDGLGPRDVKMLYAMYLLANRDGNNEKARTRLAELGKELSSLDLIQLQVGLNRRPLQPMPD